jgi:hypothetical protein
MNLRHLIFISRPLSFAYEWSVLFQGKSCAEFRFRTTPPKQLEAGWMQMFSSLFSRRALAVVVQHAFRFQITSLICIIN